MNWRRRLARGLAAIDASLVDVDRVQTNIVNCFVDRFADDAGGINRALKARGILANHKRTKIRFVTHYHIDEAAVDAAIEQFAEVIEPLRKAADVDRRPHWTISPCSRSRTRSSIRATNCTASSSRRCSRRWTSRASTRSCSSRRKRSATSPTSTSRASALHGAGICGAGGEGQAAGGRIHFRQRRSAHPLQIRYRGRAEAAAVADWATDDRRDDLRLWPGQRPHRHRSDALHGS